MTHTVQTVATEHGFFPILTDEQGRNFRPIILGGDKPEEQQFYSEKVAQTLGERLASRNVGVDLTSKPKLYAAM